MKIAVITDDSKTISMHFGRAEYYLVLSIEEKKILDRELREKLGHSHFVGEESGHGQGSGQHGFDPAAQGRHARMAQTIADCQVLLCRGMGRGAYENLTARSIQVILTDIAGIDEAVQAYIDGNIIDHTERLH
jgi:predicted Fe-Mo cluster-binding NifX family protein